MLPDGEPLNPTADPWPAVLGYLDFVQRPAPTTPAQWPELVVLLDRVAMARHACPTEGCDYDEDEHGPMPGRSYDELRQRIAPRFPEFGFYWDLWDPLDCSPTEKPSLGCAMDDLTDIACELQTAIAVRDRLGDRHGRLQFAFSYDLHSGWHLRHLQRFLHARTLGPLRPNDAKGNERTQAAPMAPDRGIDPWPAVDAFLSFVRQPQSMHAADGMRLERLLDGLTMARHALRATSSGDDSAALPVAVHGIRGALPTRFGQLGRYAQTPTLEPTTDAPGTMEPKVEIGDPIADLDCIATALGVIEGMAQRHDRKGIDVAFAAAFDGFCGRLRDLQMFLHVRVRR